MNGALHSPVPMWTEALRIRAEVQMYEDIYFKIENPSVFQGFPKIYFDLLWTCRGPCFSIFIPVCWHCVNMASVSHNFEE